VAVPLYSTEENPEAARWYYIGFISGQCVMADKGAGKNLQTSATWTGEDCWEWCLIRKGAEEDHTFILKSRRGNYVGWDGAARFRCVSDEAEAELLTLEEVAPPADNPYGGYYMIKRATTDSYKYLGQAIEAGENKDLTTFGTGQERAHLRFHTPKSLYPQFIDEAPVLPDKNAQTPWYAIRFTQNNDSTCLLASYGPGNPMLGNKYSERKFNQKWVFVKNFDDAGTFTGTFRLMSRYGLYVRLFQFGTVENDMRFVADLLEKGSDNFQLVLTLKNATSTTAAPYYTWEIERPGTGKCINPWAGAETNHQFGSFPKNQPGNVVEFIPSTYVPHRVKWRKSWFVERRAGETGYVKPIYVNPADSITINPNTGDTLQRTNVFERVHYMKPGEKRAIPLPTIMQGNPTRINQYQRWFNYRTGGPVESYVLDLGTDVAVKQYDNGTVMGNKIPVGGKTYFVDKYMQLTMQDVEKYVLAADVSRYNDLQYTDSDADMVEPTLSFRYLFEIRNAHQMAEMLTECKQGGDKWLEEYDITCPAKWNGFAQDEISIQYELQDYWFYRDGIRDDAHLQNIISNDYLYYELDNTGGAGLRGMGLHKNSSVGGSRFFSFTYPADSIVKDNDKYAELKIYARDSIGGTLYQLARIRLNFLQNSGPRPHSDIMGRNADGSYKALRSPEYMEALCGPPVAFINFTDLFKPYVSPPGGINMADWNKGGTETVEVGNTYAYPLKYNSINYAYCPSDNMKSSDKEPGWGEYSLVNYFRGIWHKGDKDFATSPVFEPVEKLYNAVYGPGSEYPDSTLVTKDEDLSGERILFIDASEEPARIARLEFDGNLCMGSRLYCSAWIASPNDPKDVNGNPRTPASLLFQFVGYRKDKADSTKETEHLLYTFYPGQITSWGLCNDNTVVKPSAENGYAGIWQQIAFSFIPDRSEGLYDRYELIIHNNCYDSQGGDILLDNIKVFVGHPAVIVEQSAPVCGQELQLMKMTVKYADLLSSVGLKEGETFGNGVTPQIWYCFLDADKYDSYKTATDVETGVPAMPDEETYRTAFYASLLGSTELTSDTEGWDYAYHHVPFSTTFEDDEVQPDYKTAIEAGFNFDKLGLYREIKSDGLRYLVLNDKIVDEKVKPGKRYYMAILPLNALKDDGSLEAHEFFDLEDRCSIYSQFTAKSSSIVRVDGDANLVVNDTIPYCAGSTPTVEVELTYSSVAGGGVYRGQCHDWWMGRLVDYNNACDDPTRPKPLYLNTAMSVFRYHYPDALSLEGVEPKKDPIGDPDNDLTAEMIALIEKYVTPPVGADGQAGQPLLYLYRSAVSVPLSPEEEEGKDKYTYLTVIPIERSLESVDAIVCYDPKEIPIHIIGKAPALFVGIPTAAYPHDDFNTPVRVMLPQIRRTQQADNPSLLRIPIRKEDFVKPHSPDMSFIAAAPYVYLASTDDPHYHVQLMQPDESSEQFTGFQTVGTFHTLHAINKHSSADPSYLEITFLPDFTPREGFTYTLKAWFEENIKEDDLEPGEVPCHGTILFDMKVVPEYVVWTGATGHDEWNNDLNWMRAGRDTLFAGRGGLDDYPSNAANGTSAAFVPMRYTHVVVPTPRAPQEGAASVPAPHPVLLEVTRKADDEIPLFAATAPVTSDIEYDLAVRNPATGTSLLTCETFTPNVCDHILFQPGAELLRAERLAYERAWVEYELTPHRWYTLASPLQGMYAGDWYAPSVSGRQETTRFFPIAFSLEGGYDRFRPAVYQRTWDKDRAEALVYRLAAGEGSTLVGSNPEPVAVRADWSQVYNDVAVPYGQCGFSLKADADRLGDVAPAKLLFRFPKSDAQYTYYTVDQTTDGRTCAPLVRSLSHKLNSDYLSTMPMLMFPLSGAEGRYHLVGNPFICGLDMNEFFKQNEWAEPKYWVMTAEGQRAALRDEGSASGWVTPDGGDASILAPLQSFFVKLKDGEPAATAGAPRYVTFTADMQRSASSASVTLQAPARRTPAAASATQGVLRITARRDGYGSAALLRVTPAASSGYDPREDAETLLDSNASADGVPTVYTLADGRALTINSLDRPVRIPLGVESSDDRPVTLRFSGAESLDADLFFLDAVTGEAQSLAADLEVTVPGRTLGRYFLVSSLDDTPAAPAQGVRIAVAGQEVTLTAASSSPLQSVRVVDTAARPVYESRPAAATHTFRLQKGAYVVEVRTDSEHVVRKVMVR